MALKSLLAPKCVASKLQSNPLNYFIIIYNLNYTFNFNVLLQWDSLSCNTFYFMFNFLKNGRMKSTKLKEHLTSAYNEYASKDMEISSVL